MASRLPRPALRGAVCVLVTCLFAACRAASPAEGRPLLVVGLDAADWRVVDPLIQDGSLPAFARLRAAGRTGVLVADPPLLSPILWTSIATGRPAEEHGVLDFMVDTPDGGQAPVGAASRLVPAVWNVLSDAGRSVAVIGWWATWPAEALHGTLVSDRVAPQLLRPDAAALDAHAITPEAARARLLPLLVRPSEITNDELRQRVPADEAELAAARAGLARPGRAYEQPLAHLAAVVAATRSYTAIAEDLLRRDKPDFLAVYLEAIDSVSHRFVREARGTPVIAAAYADVDAALLRLAQAAPPETWVVVVSDHGFHPASAGIAEDPADLAGPATAWHRPYGIVAAIEARALLGAGSPAGAPVPDVTALDVAPTLLHAAGLAVGDRMTGRVVTELLPPEAAARPVERARLLERGPTLPAVLPSADPEAVARLRALGYVGATTTSLARLNLGEILYRRGRLEAAERELRAVTEAQPANLPAWLWLARAAADQGRTADALRAWRAALRLPGGPREAIVPAVEFALGTTDPPAAQALLDTVPAAERASAPVLVAHSLVLRQRGRKAEADRLLRAAVTNDALCVEALERLLGLAPERDLPAFRRAAGAAPDSPRLVALHGAALLAAGRAEDAERVLAHALALAPGADSVRLAIAHAQLKQGHFDAVPGTLVGVQPSLEAATLRGVAHSFLKHWPEAEHAYAEALQLAPSPTPELLNGLAWAVLQQGRRDEARALIQRSLGLRPDQPQIDDLRRRIEAGS